MSSPPTRTRAPWRARARISPGLGWWGRWRSSRPICSPKDARRSSSATRRGCRRAPTRRIEHAIYDPREPHAAGFSGRAGGHLEPGGEGWLILSDLAEHLGLRSREALLAAFDAAGLKVVGRLDVKPTHPRASDATDPLHAARAAEVTSLWRLAAR